MGLEIKRKIGQTMTKYRAGIIVLGWMGFIYDVAEQVPPEYSTDIVERYS